MADLEGGQRDVVPADAVAESALEIADDILDVERHPPEAEIVRPAEARVDTGLPCDYGRPRQIGVEDRAALKAVRQGVADGHELVDRRRADRRRRHHGP